MKIKSFVTLSLFFALSFSIVHEFAFASFHDEHCNSVSEYVHELQSPSEHGDVCDTHFEYHQAYLLPQHAAFMQHNTMAQNSIFESENYTFHINLDFLKPPIA